MYDRWRRHAVLWLIPVFLSVSLLGACALPEPMRVRAGIDPRNQDDQVRFRTTYYFRVFDVCRNPDNSKMTGPPRNDSLYRFRMTGKAKSLFTQVHFESGTLHKSEIDPFGSNVIFDEKLGRYRFVSREETDAAARRNERYDEIERLVDLLKDLVEFDYKHLQQAGAQAAAKAINQRMMELVDITKKLPANDKTNQAIAETIVKAFKQIVNLDPSTDDKKKPEVSDKTDQEAAPDAGKAVKQLMIELVNSIKKQIVNLDTITVDSSIKSKDDRSKPGSSDAKGCPEGTELKRGFQIMGPEGISTFNQNQRLIMAMTSSGKPLIGTLKELSGRMLAEHGSGREFLLPLAQENIAILRAKRIVDKSDPNVSIDELIERVIDAFNQDVPKEAR